jgi:hypothetical protein
MSDAAPDEKPILPQWAWIGLAVAFLVLMATPLCVIIFTNITKEQASALGDAYNVVNTLFSGLAFLGIILTVLLQSRELKLQRRELELQRKEIEQSVKAQEESAQALKLQADLLAKSTVVAGVSAEALKTQATTMAAAAKILALSGRVQRVIDEIRQLQDSRSINDIDRRRTDLIKTLAEFNRQLDDLIRAL